jgi:hypothetical protein
LNDIERLSRNDVATFFAQHYQPRNLAVAIVGDLSLERAQHLAHKYFGDWYGQDTDKRASEAGSSNINCTMAPSTSAAMNCSLTGNTQGLQSSISLGAAAGHNSIQGPGKPALQHLSSSTADKIGTLDGPASLGTQVGSTGNAAMWGPGDMRGTARPSNLAGNQSMTVPSLIGPAAFLCFYRPGTTAMGPTVALDALGDVLSSSKSSRAYRQFVSTGMEAFLLSNAFTVYIDQSATMCL